MDHGQPLLALGVLLKPALGVFSLFALPVILHQGARRFGVKIVYLGAATITASVVSLLLALSWVGEGYDWDAFRVVVGFVIAAVLLAAFIPIEHRASEPVIPLSLFKSRVFTSSALLMFMVGIGMFGIILYTPLLVQDVLGKTATRSGTVLTPLVLTMTAMGVAGSCCSSYSGSSSIPSRTSSRTRATCARCSG